MKNLPVYIVIFISVLALNSCTSNCDTSVYYYAKVPVYGSIETLRKGFEIKGVQPMDTITQIVELDHAYFLEEKGKGVHVVDKINFTEPKRIAFISIPGYLSLEAINNTLYVGQATDLVSIDVSDLNSIQVEARISNVFNADYVKSDSFIVGYTEAYVRLILEDAHCAETHIMPENRSEIESQSVEPHVDLHITNNHLHACDNKNVSSFSISGGDLTFRASNSIVSGRNTGSPKINSTREFVAVGTPRSNIFLFQTDGSLSRVVSTFVSSPFTCGNFYLFQNAAIYTDFRTSSNQNCNSQNTLHIHPINGLSQPFMPRQFPFTQPQSISIMDSSMLLCDGNAGFSLFDFKNPSTFNPDSDMFDEITTVHSAVSALSKERILIWGNDGLFYFNVEQPTNIRLITEIK